MAAVRGNHPSKVDEKGRLKLPAGVREYFGSGEGVEVYITSTNGQEAQIWPLDKWEEVEQKAARHSLDPNVQIYLDTTSYWGKQVEIDSQGRVMLPQLLRENAGLSGDVAILVKSPYLSVHLDTTFKSTRLREMTAEQLNLVSQKIMGA